MMNAGEMSVTRVRADASAFEVTYERVGFLMFREMAVNLNRKPTGLGVVEALVAPGSGRQQGRIARVQTQRQTSDEEVHVRRNAALKNCVLVRQAKTSCKTPVGANAGLRRQTLQKLNKKRL